MMTMLSNQESHHKMIYMFMRKPINTGDDHCFKLSMEYLQQQMYLNQHPMFNKLKHGGKFMSSTIKPPKRKKFKSIQ